MNWSPLHSAAAGDRILNLNVLLEMSDKSKLKAIMNKSDTIGRTALHVAIEKNNVSTVERLLQEKDIQTSQSGLESELHCAARLGFKDIVRRLLFRNVVAGLAKDSQLPQADKVKMRKLLEDPWRKA